jgi:hypothetical protein
LLCSGYGELKRAYIITNVFLCASMSNEILCIKRFCIRLISGFENSCLIRRKGIEEIKDKRGGK